MLKSHAVLVVAFGSALLGACTATRPRPLAPAALDELLVIERTPATTGEQIYEGRVYPLDGRSGTLFRYERRVQTTGSSVTSTHLTHDPSGAVVVVQSAVHSPTYDLTTAATIHRQTGASATVAVENGEATFMLTDGGRQSVSHERVEDPVVAGPTMFGFILAHWDELERGVTIPIRFALLERGETLGFVLDKVPASEGRTTIRMKPTSLLVRMAVAPTYFEFETASRRILEYTGRVPPMEQVDDRLQTLDARVAYTFTAPEFR
jgi:hypothetical protein